MKKTVPAVICFVLLSCWFSCTKDTAIPPPAPPVCDSTHISYTTTVAPIIANNCALSGCHGNPPGSGANSLTSYINVKTEMEADSPAVNSILCRVQSRSCGDIMPLGTNGLRKAYVDTLELWKSGGYCN